jgi:flagellar protein FliS
MYPQGNPYSQYRATAIATANPEKLLLMLYDGLLSSLRQARQALDSGEIQAAHRLLIKGQDIVSELNRTLNRDYEISGSLSRLYDYLYRRLVEANLKKDPAALDEVLELISGLRAAWAEAMECLYSHKTAVSGSGR